MLSASLHCSSSQCRDVSSPDCLPQLPAFSLPNPTFCSPANGSSRVSFVYPCTHVSHDPPAIVRRTHKPLFPNHFSQTVHPFQSTNFCLLILVSRFSPAPARPTHVGPDIHPMGQSRSVQHLRWGFVNITIVKLKPMNQKNDL